MKIKKIAIGKVDNFVAKMSFYYPYFKITLQNYGSELK